MLKGTNHGTTPAVSVVAPCHDEADGLGELHRRVAAACRAVAGEAFEIVLVDDGSRDRTWELIGNLAETDPHVVGVHLMRNHGHQLAATAGLAVARGERVLLIDADLQDPPELLAEMMALMDQGADVVYGQRRARHGESWFKTWSAAQFYRLLEKLATVTIPRDTGDFRLMTRRVVDVLLAMPERERFIRGMVSWIGGRQVPLLYVRQSRHAGQTKYNLTKMLRFATDAITGFSIVPLRLATWLGLTMAVFALLLLGYTVYSWLAGHVVAGWASLMTAITVFASVQLVVLGIIGEYLGRLMNEIKGRPLYLIDTVRTREAAHPLPVDFSRLSRPAQTAVLERVHADAGTPPVPRAVPQAVAAS